MRPHRTLAIAGALAASILCLSAIASPQDDGAKGDDNQAATNGDESDVAAERALEAWRWDVTRERWVVDDASTWAVGLGDAVGELHSVLRMNLASGDTPLRLRMKDGRARLVDLGPGLTPAAFGIESGERIWVQGGEAVVDGLRVLLADRIAVERDAAPEQDDEEDVRRDSDDATDQRSRVVAAMRSADVVSARSASYAFIERARSEREAIEEPVVEEIAGRIESAWRLPLDGTGAGRALVKLGLANGIDAIVDLGSERMVDQVDLDDGELVWIAGVREQFSGFPVLRAREVRIDGALYVVPAGGE